MHQLKFDLQRADQTAILKQAQFHGDGFQSAPLLKAVLTAIDSYARLEGECFASMGTIGRDTGYHKDTVKKAVRILKRKSLVTCELKTNRYGIRTNHYRIVWNELALLSPQHADQAVGNDRRSPEPSNPYASPSRSHGNADHQLSATIGNERSNPRGQLDDSRGQPSRPRGQLDGPRGQHTPQTVLTIKPPPTTNEDREAVEDVSDGWTAAREALRLCGVKARKQAIDLAKAQLLRPADVVAICEEYKRFKSKLSSVGAILFRIEQGDWPIDPPPPSASAPKGPKPDDPPPGDIRAPMTEEERRLFAQFGIQ